MPQDYERTVTELGVEEASAPHWEPSIDQVVLPLAHGTTAVSDLQMQVVGSSRVEPIDMEMRPVEVAANLVPSVSVSILRDEEELVANVIREFDAGHRFTELSSSLSGLMARVSSFERQFQVCTSILCVCPPVGSHLSDFFC
jgi:hypothetical protein